MTYNNGKYGDVIKNMWCPLCKKETTFTELLTAPGGYLDGIICDSCGENLQHKEPPYHDLHVYKAKCKCGKMHTFLTQDDRSPEYYTQVGHICDCGEAVFISLPVN